MIPTAETIIDNVIKEIQRYKLNPLKIFTIKEIKIIYSVFNRIKEHSAYNNMPIGSVSTSPIAFSMNVEDYTVFCNVVKKLDLYITKRGK